MTGSSNEPNDLKPVDGGETGKGPNVSDELPTTPEQAAIASANQRLELERSRLQRHRKGTDQVELILKSGHLTASLLIALASLLACTIFWMGLRALVNSIETKIAWYTQLLVFIPTTLLAILGITVWITSLKFSAQIYNGATDTSPEDSSLVSECIKLGLEATKQNSSP